jgi:hypothetical protein
LPAALGVGWVPLQASLPSVATKNVGAWVAVELVVVDVLDEVELVVVECELVDEVDLVKELEDEVEEPEVLEYEFEGGELAEETVVVLDGLLLKTELELPVLVAGERALSNSNAANAAAATSRMVTATARTLLETNFSISRRQAILGYLGLISVRDTVIMRCSLSTSDHCSSLKVPST